MSYNLLFVYGHIFGGLGYQKNQLAFYLKNIEKDETCVVKLLPSEKQEEYAPYRCGEVSLEDCKNMRDFLDRHIKKLEQI